MSTMELTAPGIEAQDVVDSMMQSLRTCSRVEMPYRHWFLTGCLPPSAVSEVLSLPFSVPDLHGLSGKRELHNATRNYFDSKTNDAHPVCREIADAFHEPGLIAAMQTIFDVELSGTYLRIEFAQDTDGFWLEPHTDLGVKRFTMLLYLSSTPGHENLGTDIYDEDRRHVGRSPFKQNGAMIFVPAHNTYHGFEKRPVPGVRKSMIINYVTDEWRARDQLARPDKPLP